MNKRAVLSVAHCLEFWTVTKSVLQRGKPGLIETSKRAECTQKSCKSSKAASYMASVVLIGSDVGTSKYGPRRGFWVSPFALSVGKVLFEDVKRGEKSSNDRSVTWRAAMGRTETSRGGRSSRSEENYWCFQG